MFIKIVLWGGLLFLMLAVIGVAALLLFGWMENSHYNKLTDTHDLPKRIDEMAAPYVAKRKEVRLTVGVSQRGKRFLKVYGSDSANDRKLIYEIGSVTKVFTAISLAHMANDGRVSLDQTIDQLLPENVKLSEKVGAITLKELATHTAGLPRLPSNLEVDNDDPYASYGPAQIYQDLQTVTLSGSKGQSSEYSNYGAGLLGHLLALSAEKSYGDLVQEFICQPLTLSSTAVTLDDELRKRFVTGRAPDGKPAPHWTFDVLAGAGALRSDAEDMVTFLEANLHPPDNAIGQALKKAQEVHFTGWTDDVGLGWQIHKDPYLKTRHHWHNGGTAGFVSYAAFNQEHDIAVVVLSNYGDAFAGDSSVDAMGLRILRYAIKISLD